MSVVDTGAAICSEGTDGGGDHAWSNASYITAHDGSYAYREEYSENGPATTNILIARQFGFSIPASSAINGVLVTVHADSLLYYNAGCTISTIQLGWNEALQGTQKTPNTGLGKHWPYEFASYDYGSSSDVWGCSLTSTIVNSTGVNSLGVGIQCYVNPSGGYPGHSTAAAIDCVWMTVYYTPPYLHKIDGVTATYNQTKCSGVLLTNDSKRNGV